MAHYFQFSIWWEITSGRNARIPSVFLRAGQACYPQAARLKRSGIHEIVARQEFTAPVTQLKQAERAEIVARQEPEGHVTQLKLA